MSELKTLSTIDTSPFKRLVLNLGVAPTAFTDGMTYYELLAWLVKYLEEEVVPKTNENIEAVKELQTYVSTYFDNLDVQEEINNKLDQMAEDGTLAEIISTYLDQNFIKTYKNEAELIADTTLTTGKYVRTFGQENNNDGEGAIYYINNVSGDITLQNGLFASLINNYENNYYDEVKVSSKMHTVDGVNQAYYYLTEIPRIDKFGNPIKLHVVPNENLRPSEYAQKYDSTFTSNASLAFRLNESDPFIDGIAIGDGEILNNYTGGYPADYGAYLGIKDNNVIELYNKTTTAQDMLVDGVKQAVFCFGAIVIDGAVNESAYGIDSGTMSLALGQKADGTILIFGNDGRTIDSKGLTVRQVANIMIEQGCVNAWELDGGGSISLNYHGNKLNQRNDENRTSERKISYLFNVQHTLKNKKSADISSTAGQIANIKDIRLQYQLAKKEGRHGYSSKSIIGEYLDPTKPNGQQKIALTQSTPNSPDTILPVYDEDTPTKLIGTTFKYQGIGKFNLTAQIENHSSSEKNFYVGLFIGTSLKYQISAKLIANGFMPVSLEWTENMHGDASKPVTIGVWGNESDNTQLQIMRGRFDVEFIPDDESYKLAV